MINTDRIRIVALEKDVKELQQGVGQLFVQLQATNKILKNISNYLMTEAVMKHKGIREDIIADLRVLYGDFSDQEFEKIVIPGINARIKIYNDSIDKAIKIYNDSIDKAAKEK